MNIVSQLELTNRKITRENWELRHKQKIVYRKRQGYPYIPFPAHKIGKKYSLTLKYAILYLRDIKELSYARISELIEFPNRKVRAVYSSAKQLRLK